MQLHYCTTIFVVLMCAVLRPEPQGQNLKARKSFAIVLTKSRCHFDEVVTAHRNEVLYSLCQSLLFPFHLPPTHTPIDNNNPDINKLGDSDPG